MMWTEQPATAPSWTPREWAFYATCAQMRADRRREEARAERREFWRETKCELLAGLAALATVCVLVGLRLWVSL